MASTYSPDLRIELLGSGDQAGTWGTTTNTNLGTLIEQSIAGNPTIAVTVTPRALTAINGAVDESRQATLTLTTTLSTAFTVLAPPVPKQYVIYNNTAYTATIGNATALNGTTPTGGTTAIIPSGGTTPVWSDGTNFSLQVTSLTNPISTSQTLVDGATINWNFNSGAVATVTLAGNRTFAAPTNLKVGTSVLVINQDATGSRLITWNAIFKWSVGAYPVLSTDPNAKDVLSFFSDGTNLYGNLVMRGAA